METAKRENWGSSVGFILAVAGSAIGLGNIWKFPYMTGMNGGGIFVLIYMLCMLLLGLPVMLCEIILGRATGRNPYGAFKALQTKRSTMLDVTAGAMFLLSIVVMLTGYVGVGIITAVLAALVAWMGFSFFGLLSIICGLLILSYYSVVGGWILDYTVQAFAQKMHYNDVVSASSAFGKIITTPWRVLLGHLAFMVLCAVFLWGGVRKGLERWSKILMPMLFILLLVVIVRGITLPGASKGIAFFLKPDFANFSMDSLLNALGQVFYSLSLGMGITITYGSYLSKKQNIFSASYSVLVLDTTVSVLAGLAIFPAVFAMNMDPAAGPGLIFHVLPATFNNIPGGLGWLWAGMFFLILGIAALTSGGSLLELAITFLGDEFKMRRTVAIPLCTAVVALVGVL
ncbi:MAG: sodium-dependent transporter, partial [Victivallales bacterium]|nr:sodium-dependent transporter [Victivallales bacterium]